MTTTRLIGFSMAMVLGLTGGLALADTPRVAPPALGGMPPAEPAGSVAPAPSSEPARELAPSPASAPGATPLEIEPVLPAPPRGEPGASTDAPAMFRQLVERYRGIEAYEDTTRVVQTTQRPGERAERIESRLTCAVQHGELLVETPAAQARRGLGLRLPETASTTPAARRLRLRYLIWLAPHMALKFADAPLESFREGVESSLIATDTASITVGERRMLQLGLQGADDAGGRGAVRFDLFIDPESMLVERIEGHQRLPDGAECQTTFEIAPSLVIPSTAQAAPEMH